MKDDAKTDIDIKKFDGKLQVKVTIHDTSQSPVFLKINDYRLGQQIEDQQKIIDQAKGKVPEMFFKEAHKNKVEQKNPVQNPPMNLSEPEEVQTPNECRCVIL